MTDPTPVILDARFTRRFARDIAIDGQLQHHCRRFSVTVLLGPSGCGKTTVLRALAGLERPESGRITFGDEVWFDARQRRFVRPQQRGVGMLFQDYALFPHLTVARNIAYGLRGDGPQRVEHLLERFGLQGLGSRRPNRLSGGQQQRVALARAVATRPRLLLLDEPMAALDANTRQDTRTQLRQLLQDAAIPAIIVTHDQDDVMALADRVVVMDRGRVLQTGPVHEVFNQPASTQVARIVGIDSVLVGQLVRSDDDLAQLRIAGRTLWCTPTALPPGPVHVCIHARDVVLDTGTPGGSSSARNRLQATVTQIVPYGPVLRVQLDCGFPLWALVTHAARSQMQLKPGDTVHAILKATAILIFPHPNP